MVNKWYNSEFANYLGGALVIFSIFSGMGSCMKGCGESDYLMDHKGKVEIMQIKEKTQIEKYRIDKEFDFKKLEKSINKTRLDNSTNY